MPDAHIIYCYFFCAFGRFSHQVIMKDLIKIVGILLTSSISFNVCANNSEEMNLNQSRVVAIVKKAESYIKKNGIKKAINKYKNENDIVIGDYNGIFFVSPLHPEQVGKNQYNYKDPTGVLVVQEEINKAKAGGGWLKGRWRKNPLTGHYQCRKIYIHPVGENYFIGSWYHYSSNKPGVCNS